MSIKPVCSHGSKSCLFQFSSDCRGGFTAVSKRPAGGEVAGLTVCRNSFDTGRIHRVVVCYHCDADVGQPQYTNARKARGVIGHEQTVLDGS